MARRRGRNRGTMALRERAARSRLLRDCEELLEQGRTARAPFEIEWHLNLAFYQGKHWWGFRNGRFWTPRLQPWRSQFVENRVQPIVRSEVAKLTRSRPKWDATPTTVGRDSLPQATMATRALEAKWVGMDMQSKYRMAVYWSRIMGAGFLKLYWNRDAAAERGEEVAIGPDGEGVVNPAEGGFLRRSDVPDSETGKYEWERLGGGDIEAAVRSPFDIYVDPLAGEEGLESAEWLIEEQVRSPREVRDLYRLAEEPQPDTEASPGIIESRSPMGRGSGKSIGVTVWELWQRPCSEFPNGRKVTWCKGMILDVDERSPMVNGRLPYVMLRGIHVPGRFWPTSPVTSIRPLNAEGNSTRAQMRDNSTRMSNPALMMPMELVQAGVKYEGVPGEVIEVDGHARTMPSFLVPPGTPRSTIEEMELISEAIDKVSHQNEVSRGNVPIGVTAASAIQLLQEAGQTTIELDASGLEDEVSRLGQMMLDLMCRYYKEERLLALAGEDEPFNVTEFRADVLAGDVPSVQVKTGSMVPRSVAARQAVMEHVLMLFLQNGVRMDPIALGNFLRQFEVGAVEDLIAGFSEDQRQVAFENKALMRGDQIPDPMEMENHAAHLAGHASMMKSPEFLALPEEQQRPAVEHYDATRKALQAKAIVEATERAQVMAAEQKALQEQLAAAGVAPPGGPGGPPSGPPGDEGGLDLSGGAPDAVVPAGSEPQLDEMMLAQMVGQGAPAAPSAPPAPQAEME